MMWPQSIVAETAQESASVSTRVDAPPFRSILFPNGESSSEVDSQPEPECFADLNLNQVVEVLTVGRAEYNLKPFFYGFSTDTGLIEYRHDVFRDLERSPFAEDVRSFASVMRRLREFLAQAGDLCYDRQKQRCFLDAVDVYCNAARKLAGDLAARGLRSSGLTALGQYLADYIASEEFRAMESEMRRLIGELEQVRYALHIDGKRVTVRRYEPEPDYGAEVLQTFEKFSQGASKEYRFDFRFTAEMNHVEAAILDRVARLYPEAFSALTIFFSRHRSFLDPVIARFDREVQFYLAWIEYTQRFKEAGLSFCYPAVSGRSKEVSACAAFDLALAEKLNGGNAPIVTNDFSLAGPERIVVVTGPNQGGKTTFGRMFGQLHYLASLGCPVAAKEASLFLCDRLFTHFEKEEEVRNLTGKLEDELLRIHGILELATPDSILIMNESFLSTTLNDALFLSSQVMERIVALDMLCVSVTFLDELAMGQSAVSMVGTVDPADPSRRTFKILRKPADGLAYAMAIAEKYRLTQDAVRARIAGHVREPET